MSLGTNVCRCLKVCFFIETNEIRDTEQVFIPDLFLGHRAVVQVEAYDVVLLQLLDGRSAPGSLLKLRVKLLHQVPLICWKPQYLHTHKTMREGAINDS